MAPATTRPAMTSRPPAPPTITADSDPVVDVRLTLRVRSWMGSGKAITHNGETLTWQEVAGSNGHGFQAVTASGTLVLTVTLPNVPGRIEAHTQATLDYQVTVHTNLDHGADDKLEPEFAGEGDRQRWQCDHRQHHGGDHRCRRSSPWQRQRGHLQEGAPGQTLDGQLPVSVGSDRLVSLNFEANQPGLNGPHQRRPADPLSGQRQRHRPAGCGQQDHSDRDPGAGWKYQVVLDGVLDQPVSTNSVNLGLQVQGTDFDGDKSNLGTLNIHITDGVLPQVDPVSLTLVEDSDWSAAQTLTRDLAITARRILWSTSHSMPASPACRGSPAAVSPWSSPSAATASAAPSTARTSSR